MPLEIYYHILDCLSSAERAILKQSCKNLMHKTLISEEEISRECLNAKRCSFCYAKEPAIYVKELEAYLCPCLVTRMISSQATRTDSWNVIFKDPAKNYYTTIAIDYKLPALDLDYSVIHQTRQSWLNAEIIRLGLLKKDLLSSSLASLRSKLSSFVHQNYEMQKDEQMAVQEGLV